MGTRSSIAVVLEMLSPHVNFWYYFHQTSFCLLFNKEVSFTLDDVSHLKCRNSKPGKILEFLVLGFTRTNCIEGLMKSRYAVKELLIIGSVKYCNLVHYNHHENYVHNTAVYH